MSGEKLELALRCHAGLLSRGQVCGEPRPPSLCSEQVSPSRRPLVAAAAWGGVLTECGAGAAVCLQMHTMSRHFQITG
jgi:hypothetical protein